MFYEFKQAVFLRGKRPTDPGKKFPVGVHEASAEDERHDYFLLLVKDGKIVKPQEKAPLRTGDHAKALHEKLLKQGAIPSHGIEAKAEDAEEEVEEEEDEETEVEDVDDVDLSNEDGGDDDDDEGFLEKPKAPAMKKATAKKVKKKSSRR